MSALCELLGQQIIKTSVAYLHTDFIIYITYNIRFGILLKGDIVEAVIC